MTFQELQKNEMVKAYIQGADATLGALGFTEHSFSHVGMTAERCKYILETLGYDERTVELAQMAAWLHDIGNLANRVDHSMNGAVMAFQILSQLGMDPKEIAMIVPAIGNHDEGTGKPISPLAAAMILADKSDVRRSRVRNEKIEQFDIHDRVNYSVKERSKQPQTLAEASLAMAYIREHAEEYNVNPDRVFVVGFSAGGHLAGMLGTQWHSDVLKDVINSPEGSNRPTGMILCYPVLSYFPKTHIGTFNNAFGTDSPTEEQIKFCSVEKNVSDLTCPAFLMHTADDTAVNVGNTLKMAVALEENNIPFEVHIYPHGPHGIALANEITAAREGQYDERIARWPELAREWMKRI